MKFRWEDIIISSPNGPDCSTSMIWDIVNSATTILQSDSAIIYVLNGAGPFTYTLTGTGYTFAANGLTEYTTASRNVTINADAVSCGGCEITVVDACATAVTNSVRNTDAGQWVNYLCSGLSDCAGIPIYLDLDTPDAGWPPFPPTSNINVAQYFTVGMYKIGVLNATSGFFGTCPDNTGEVFYQNLSRVPDWPQYMDWDGYFPVQYGGVWQPDGYNPPRCIYAELGSYISLGVLLYSSERWECI